MTEMQVFSAAPTGRAEFKAVKAQMKHEIARVLDALGRTCGMETVHESHPQEFLYDVVWIAPSGTMGLAVECETSMYVADVLYDFRKLLYAKAPLKLMVFSDSAQLRRQSIIDRIADELKAFHGHLPGEEYIVVQFCNFQTGCLEAYRFVATRSVELEKFHAHTWPTSRGATTRPLRNQRPKITTGRPTEKPTVRF